MVKWNKFEHMLEIANFTACPKQMRVDTDFFQFPTLKEVQIRLEIEPVVGVATAAHDQLHIRAHIIHSYRKKCTATWEIVLLNNASKRNQIKGNKNIRDLKLLTSS